jgi:hypothetical protein
MARTVAALPAGSRITDYISLGVIARFFPVEKIHEVLKQTNRASIRERDLPAHVVIYYVIALAVYMRSSYREVLRCLLEGVQWLLDPSAKVKVAGKSGISQARSRLGAEPLKKLYDAVVAPIAKKRTKGALVPSMATGESRREYLGCRRYCGKRQGLWASGRQSGFQCFPQDPFRGAAGERHARVVGRAYGPIPHGRTHAGRESDPFAPPGNVVSGRPVLP